MSKTLCECRDLFGGRWDGKGTQVVAADCPIHGKRRPDPRQWEIALAKIRDGIDELFEQGEDEDRVRKLVLSQLRQVLDDREER